jgi:hypothetical protein
MTEELLSADSSLVDLNTTTTPATPLRHFTLPADAELLAEKLPDYFAEPRGGRRKHFINEKVLPILSSEGQWTSPRVAAWFRNNRVKYESAERAANADAAVVTRKDLDEATQGINRRLDEVEHGIVASLADEMAKVMNALSSQASALQNQISSLQEEMSEKLKAVGQALPPSPSPAEVTTQSAILFISANLPVSLADRPAFREFTHKVAPTLEFPRSTELRKEILDQAAGFRNAFNVEVAGGPYLSLMIDGSSMAGRKWLGVCIATAQAFYFWRVLRLPDNKGKTIAASLAEVVAELRAKDFIIAAIVTDNASNEIAAVKELASRTHLPLVRVPCISHTVNLAVHDFFTAVFGKGVFEDHMRELHNALPTHEQGDPF